MLKPEVSLSHARKTPRGRFCKLYTARLGQVEAVSFNRSEAIAECERLALSALEQVGRDPEVLWLGDREAIVVHPSRDGAWEYHFARQTGGEIQASKSGYCIANEPREETLERALRHAQDYIADREAA